MKELFTIGEVAKLFQLNIRTLRYYDEIGILKPELLNEKTGYRYYSTKQFERLNTIKYLRNLNMPLEKIKQFFEKREVSAMEAILEEQLEETRKQIVKLQNMEQKLNRRLSQLRAVLEAPLGVVREMSIKMRPVAFLRRNIRQGEDLEYSLRELERLNHLQPVMFLGKVGLSIGQEELIKREFSHFSGIFVFLEKEDQYDGESKYLTAGDYVTIMYSGTHQDSREYYEMLLDYMKEHGLTGAGDSVEITWIDAGFTDEAGQYVTELQIPVKKLHD